jgi:hypothetical protein
MKRLVLFILGAICCASSLFAQPTSIRLLEPANGSTLRAGSSVDLVWDTTGTFRSRFRFEFATSPNGPFTTIVANRLDTLPAANRGRFNGGFRIPSESTTSLFVRMTLLNADGTTPSNLSVTNGPMTIARPLPTQFDSTLRGRVAQGQTITLSPSKIYSLDGYFYVDGTLNIQPGTVIIGDTVGQNSAICVNRGGRIFAQGTATRPIVMTSSAPPQQRAAGDWGGLLICGRAPANNPGGTATLEGGIGNTATGDGVYGGTDPNDNSGVVRYVRIEFAGIAAAPNQELNSLTMGGVGRGTIIEYVQCSFGNDDAFEWFGGTVDGKYLVANGTLDDDFDGDNGWSGRVQFAVSQRYRLRADVSTSQAFEMDNDAGGSLNQPQTRAIFSNVTAIGPVQDNSWTTGRGENQFNAFFGAAAQLRRNTRVSILNTVFVGWPRGIDILSTGTQTAAAQDSVQIRNNSWYGVRGAALQLDGTTPGIPATWLETAANNNVLSAASVAGAALSNPFIENSNAFDARPTANAPYLSNSATFERRGAVAIDDSFFTRVPYRGAFNVVASGIVNRWDLPWSLYDPQSFEYRANGPTQTITSVRDNTLDNTALDVVVFPLPITDLATVRYNLAVPSLVTVKIVNALGNETFTIASGVQQVAGIHEFRLNALDLNSGMYFVQIITNNGTTMQKFTVVR